MEYSLSKNPQHNQRDSHLEWNNQDTVDFFPPSSLPALPKPTSNSTMTNIKKKIIICSKLMGFKFHWIKYFVIFSFIQQEVFITSQES